jgi:predicted house-cleaning noncanonical NTP pyrophosphatase (MazG superfamily)
MPSYRKLVRDKIPDIIRANGEEPTIHIATEEEYIDELVKKCSEEIQEFLEEPSLEEAGDILEVLYALCVAKGINPESIEEERKKKYEKRGGFEQRIILDGVDTEV